MQIYAQAGLATDFAIITFIAPHMKSRQNPQSTPRLYIYLFRKRIVKTITLYCERNIFKSSQTPNPSLPHQIPKI